MSEQQDPVVEELHSVRKLLVAEHGGSLDGVCEWLQTLETEYREHLVAFPHRPVAIPGDQETPREGAA